MKKLKIIIPLLLISSLVLWMAITLASNKKELDKKAAETEPVIPEIPVNIAVAEFVDFDETLQLNGDFFARKELNIIAETQGSITQMLVKEGQKVSKGQLIAKINDATFSSQLATAQAALTKAEKDLERYENLLEVGAISVTQFEEVSLDVKNKATNLTSIKQQLQYTNIKSPLSGVINEVLLEEGSFVNPGNPIAKVVDISSLKMIVKVDEKEVIKIKENQTVTILTEVYPNVEFKGVISQVSVQADAAKKYEITIELKNNDKEHPLKAGMYGTVVIPTNNKENNKALAIPRKSVVGSLQNPQVYLAIDGKAILIDIEVGKTIGELVYVLKGLKEGDQVISTGQINLDNGRAINIINK